MLARKWGELLLLVICALWYSSLFFKSKHWPLDLSLELLLPYPWGQSCSCSYAPSPPPLNPHHTPTLSSFKKIFFLPVLSFWFTIKSHTQKHVCYSVNGKKSRLRWNCKDHQKINASSGAKSRCIRRDKPFYLRHIFNSCFFIIVHI